MVIKLLKKYWVFVLLIAVITSFVMLAKWYIGEHNKVVAEFNVLKDNYEELDKVHKRTLLSIEKNNDMATESLDKDQEIKELRKEILHLLNVKIEEEISNIPEGATDEDRINIVGGIIIDSMWDFYERGTSLHSGETK